MESYETKMVMHATDLEKKNDEEGVKIHGVIVVAKNVGKLWSCSTENTWRLKHTWSALC